MIVFPCSLAPLIGLTLVSPPFASLPSFHHLSLPIAAHPHFGYLHRFKPAGIHNILYIASLFSWLFVVDLFLQSYSATSYTSMSVMSITIIHAMSRPIIYNVAFLGKSRASENSEFLNLHALVVNNAIETTS